MEIAERRKEIMKILCRRRHEKISNLAFEFNVDYRTMRRDIEALSLTEPIYTKTGRYGGGVYVMDGYYIDRIYMSDNEIQVLTKIESALRSGTISSINRADMALLNQIVSDYSKPRIQERK